MVRMCLVRLLNYLRLNKITHVSFAEYHSKQNFVEHVHAEEIKHGPFNSRSVQPQARNQALQGTHGRRDQEVHRSQLHSREWSLRMLCFMKKKGSIPSYTVEWEREYGILPIEVCRESECCCECVALSVGDDHFEGSIWGSTKPWTMRWLQKWGLHRRTSTHTTALHSATEGVQCRRYELQPILDYLHRYRTGEL